MPSQTSSPGALPAFSGTPARYRRIAILLTLGIHAWLYFGFAAIKYFLWRDTWVFGAVPIGVTLLSTVLFGRFTYQWMMRLDARYGSGSGWVLERRTVKLPELAPRRPKARRR